MAWTTAFWASRRAAASLLTRRISSTPHRGFASLGSEQVVWRNRFDSEMKGRKFSENHMWVKKVHGNENGNEATVGISEHGRLRLYRRQHVDQMGYFADEKNYVHETDQLSELLGEKVSRGCSFIDCRTKRGDMAGLLSPVSGKVVEVNDKIDWWLPHWIEESPYKGRWMIKVEMEDASELEKLMDANNYIKFCHDEEAKNLKETESIRERVLDGLKYSATHEWVKVDGNVATIGITRFGLVYMGTVKHVQLPNLFEQVGKYKSLGEKVLETTTGFDFKVNSPVSGKIVEVNKSLESSPELVNCSPYEEGWIVKVEMNDASELEELADFKEYWEFKELERVVGTTKASVDALWDFGTRMQEKIALAQKKT